MGAHAHRKQVTTGPEPVPVSGAPSEAATVAEERSKLLARKYGGHGLSQGEQERLQLLTARLEELLPPVSIRDLEALLEMTEEVERIRERARERRQRSGLI